MSFRDISKTIKAYDKKVSSELKKENTSLSSPKIKKPSISSQSFMLYQKGKKIDEVKVLLDIPFKKAMIFWGQYLKSIRMEDCYQFSKQHSYEIPTFLLIKNFIERNNVSGKEILHVLKSVTDVIHLRVEIERLQNMKNNYSLKQNTNYVPLRQLGLPEHHYSY